MALIAGVLRLDGPPNSPCALRGLMERMSHRAPDGFGVFEDEWLMLGHGALHATPESIVERQPIRLGERWVVVVDGRIDNRDELFRALAEGGAALSDTSDADLFALAWQRWGVGFWQHLQGDFALAAWDRSERRLVLLRDPVGVRPIYLVRNGRMLAFASEPEALLDLDGVSRNCDEEGLAYLLADAFDNEDRERTLYRDVRRLLPGWMLQVDTNGQLRKSKYWQPSESPEHPVRDPRDHVARFKELFDAAVHCRLRGTARPTLLLSGGIDSASVMASVRRLQQGGAELPLRLLSLIETVEPVSDESRNIRRLHAGTDGLMVPVESLQGKSAFLSLLETVWDAAHPIDNSLLYARLGCIFARETGSRVVMDGADGDVVMTSNSSLAGNFAASGHVLRAVREARLASRFNTYLRGESAPRILLRGLGAAMQPDWMARWRYRRREQRDRESGAGQWIDAGFARRLQVRERGLDAALAARERRSHLPRSEQLAWIWSNPGFQRAMEGTDRTYGHFGIEAWHPWCDQRVVDFFRHLPEDCLARDGWTKWVARTACAPELGNEVAWHSGKSHLGVALGPLLLNASHERVAHLLEYAQEQLAGVVAADSLAQLRRDWVSDPQIAIEREGDALLHLATLGGWIERYRLQVSCD